jgi:TatD DNase family protein
MIDAHIHLNQYGLPEADRLIEEWINSGVRKVVAVSTDLASSYETLTLKRRYPTFIYAAVGYHPEQPIPSEKDVLEMLSLIKSERHLVSAIGEVGLPHYTLSNHSNPINEYMDILSLFMDYAKKEDLPVLLHAVHDKAYPALQLLNKYNLTKAHFHWLKAPVEIVDKIIKAGYFISVTPEVCYRERDQRLAETVPLNQLLLETDGPWSFGGPFVQEKTTPKLLLPTAKQVASLKGISLEELLQQCRLNIVTLFG